jgi:hypothetical protein
MCIYSEWYKMSCVYCLGMARICPLQTGNPLVFPAPARPVFSTANSNAVSLLKMSDQVGAHLAGRHGQFQSWTSSNDHPASLHTTAAFLYLLVPHCSLPSPLFTIPATLGLVASPLGVMILPVVTWISIDSLISHCPRSPDWRPHAPTTVVTLHQ